MLSILLFGSGEYYQRYKKWFDGFNIVGILDNNINKHGTYIDGIKVFFPAEGIRKHFDRIYILARCENVIRMQLQRLGVRNQQIYTRQGIGEVTKRECQLQIYGEHPQVGEKKILVLSNDFSLGGASIALLNAAYILKKHKFDVVMAAEEDGPLRKVIVEAGISVIIDDSLFITEMEKHRWIADFALIVMNTVGYYSMLANWQHDMPVIWWIHEGQPIYANFPSKTFKDISKTNLFVYAVGKLAQRPFSLIRPDILLENLLYGITDFCPKREVGGCVKAKVVFAIVGRVSKEKAQDIFLDAIQSMDIYKANLAEFWIIGTLDSKFGDEIKKRAGSYSNVKILGELNRLQMEKVFEQIDVVVVPSRNDTMPISATEAMMNYKICIVARNVGIAEYIEDLKNGLLSNVQDAQDLKKKMEWVIDHPECRAHIGMEARKTYEEKFSIEVFRDKWLRLIHRALNI